MVRYGKKGVLEGEGGTFDVTTKLKK
jgi:hypothetical protein